MPAPVPAVMATLAKKAFKGYGLKVPLEWPQNAPATDLAKKQFNDAMQPAERNVPVPGEENPADLSVLFKRYKTCLIHTKVQSDQSTSYGALIDKLCATICTTWTTWQNSATAVGIACSLLPPLPVPSGQCVGAVPFTPPLLAAVGPSPLVSAIGGGIDAAWQTFQSSLKFIGLLMAPIGPVPPGSGPTPGTVPLPLQVCCPTMKPIDKESLLSMMGVTSPKTMPNDPLGSHGQALACAIADAFAQCFTTWASSTIVSSPSILFLMINPTPFPVPGINGVGNSVGPIFI